MNQPTRARRTAFSLIELMIVLAVIAILAAIVLPTFQKSDDSALTTTALANRRTIHVKVQESFATSGVYPDTIEASWFKGGVIPDNPLVPDWTGDTVEVFSSDDDPSRRVPERKVVNSDGAQDGWSRPIWYSSYAGDVYFRIEDQGSDAANIELFNEVNGLQITDIDQTGP